MTETQTICIGALSFTLDIAGPASGAPVLLLHGFPQSRYAWRHQLKALGEAGFRAIAPDQRGYSAGARPSDPNAYTLDKLVGDAAGIMTALGHERFHLVGHDWGGQLAWTLAATAPERVLSLAVLSRPHPAAFAESLKQDPAQAQRSGHHRSLLADGVAESLRNAGLKPLRDALAAGKVPPDAIERYIATLSEPGALEAAIDWYRSAGAALRDAGAARTPQRTLYVWGDSDSTVGRWAAERTSDHVDGPYRFEAIAGAGHFLTDEAPDRIDALLCAHLRG